MIHKYYVNSTCMSHICSKRGNSMKNISVLAEFNGVWCQCLNIEGTYSIASKIQTNIDDNISRYWRAE